MWTELCTGDGAVVSLRSKLYVVPQLLPSVMLLYCHNDDIWFYGVSVQSESLMIGRQ